MRIRDSVVRARVNGKLKHDVENVLSRLGLSMSDVINVLFSQIKLTKGLPFDVKIPNKLTQKTLKESAEGKNVKRFNTVDELFEDLDIE